MSKIYNIENLRSRQLTSAQAAELGRKGGAASGAARRRKKELKESLSILLEMDINSEKAKDEMRNMGIDDEKLIYKSYLVYSLFKRALNGNMEAFREIRNLSDEIEDEKEKIESREENLFERAQQLMRQYVESSNLHNCDECEKFADVRLMAEELKDAIDYDDERKLRYAAERMIEYLDI
ncbi:MAG: hypothetical protein GYA50_08915 [Eubacteriaceae bacterium]|nr:hypothetical protein [Eubacteriaceae bacterium]